jgi:hypothetical protein
VEFLNNKQPDTRQEFSIQYLSELRSSEQVVKMVEEFAAVAGLTLELALNWWWIRVMDQSFTGWQEEGQIMEMVRVQLQGTGNDVRKATDQEDREFGIDLVIFNIETGKDVEGLQVKPASYFSGMYPSNVEAREVTNPEKFRKYQAARGAGARYVVTDDSLRYGYPIYQNTHKSFKTANRFEKFKR